MSKSQRHLRDKRLRRADAVRLVQDFHERPRDFDALASFSMSYNRDIGDAGVLAVLCALPDSVSEVGLVGCGLTDASADALQHWIETAPNLRMICMERNEFGIDARQNLAAIKGQHASLIVIV